MEPSSNRPASNQVVVLSGGVGAARFLNGLIDAIDPSRITAVVNTGDDTVLHGLSISPDLDTITYTLAGAIDPERGWGLRDESWRAIEALSRYAAVRPAGSDAAPLWFNLGDQDLATHFYRTARLAEGATLTEVTGEIARAWGLPIDVIPMTDDRLSTMVGIDTESPDGMRDAMQDPANTDSIEEISFQDYFVRLRHGVPVRSVRFDGHASVSAPTRAAIEHGEVIVIAPSNPIVSLGPMRSLPGFDELLARRRDRTVAVSPIVGGAALKGPAAHMLDELGHEASVVGIARLYCDVASVLVIDPVDEHLAPEIERTGMRCVVAPSVMSSPDVARRLAESTLAAVAP